MRSVHSKTSFYPNVNGFTAVDKNVEKLVKVAPVYGN